MLVINLNRAVYTIFIIFFLVPYFHRVQAQDSCKEYIFNDVETAIIGQYISSCVSDHWFIGDKGVVEVIIFTNPNGEKCWYLSVLLDDRYKENPPLTYAYSHGDVVLIYQGDSKINKQKTIPNEKIISCLEEVILDRLYIRPPPKERFAYIFDKKVKVGKRQCLGRCANDLMIIFHDNGTYEKKLVF
jgi:hypothetical protein